MHILYHHRTAGDRVEAVHIMGMVNAFRHLGHTVEICSPPGCDPEMRKDAAASAQLPPAGLRTRLKRFARKGSPALFEIAELSHNGWSLGDMIRRARGRKPDLIYERMTSNSFAPTLLARWWKVPIVQEVNVTAEISRLRPLVLRRMALAVERWVAKRTTCFLTVSEQFKRMLAEAGFPEERIVVCPNAIDPQAFDPASIQPEPRPAHLGSDAVIAGYVGAFVPYHRLDVLVETARAMSPEHPALRWLLVGDGTDLQKVEDLIYLYNLRDRFWLPGAVPHHRVPGLVQAMDIAVLPSSERFNSPMKLFEYMAMGKPVIAPDMPAVKEVLTDGENGLLFRSGDASSFAAALRRALADPALRQRIGRQAREKALREHTWLRNAQRLLNAVPLASSSMERKSPS